jgi:D-alanyl-D-alanine carboxypeptidase
VALLAPTPRPATATPNPILVSPAAPKAAAVQPAAKPIAVAPASKLAAAVPAVAPSLRPDVGEGDMDQPGTTVSGRNWTIQIGAYADKALAKAQLDSYAQKAQDVVGQAERIIAPITNPNGHTLYRARFGLYAERDARQVCGRLTQRGQTCFAALAR